MAMTDTGAPEALHLGADDLPFVEIGDGNKLKVLHVDEKEGLWIVENIFQAGYEVQRHRHTGPVWGYTTSGAWKYKEYDYVNRAGSFLYEPAGSVHTLTCIEDDTQVWFHMYGVNLNLAADGSIESVADGAGALAAYYALCEAQGFDRPNVNYDQALYTAVHQALDKYPSARFDLVAVAQRPRHRPLKHHPV